ncbi:hypothetical protein ACFQ0X_43480 [Streptomyces rectiviolaceus]|uniref:hypothetical protein n=1 Tax=Streptomyces rectiviolaceus TaxID=332591 RepID=UPI00362F6034
MDTIKKWSTKMTARGMVLGVLGAITVGVAVLSVAVSYQILVPAFGVWASPTVGALDALWLVLQATEILAANNRRRASRVQWAGLGLTAVIAAIPTADLILSRSSGDAFDLATVLTPVAIVATKGAWWLVLPSLGRSVSAATRQTIAARRQEVADRLEQMEADAAARIELLTVAKQLEEQIGKATTAYRKATLKEQQTTTDELHKQATATEKTIAEKPLPALVASIKLPELDSWAPVAPALPVTPAVTGRHTPGTQVNALTGSQTVTSPGMVVTLAELSAVRGVPTPHRGEQLTDAQLGVVLRYLRYGEDPPSSYRKASESFWRLGYQGSAERLRRVWADEVTTEEDETENDDESEESDREAHRN